MRAIAIANFGRLHRCFGREARNNGSHTGLWGETDPEELLGWWLRIAENREEWNRLGRENADAVKALSWRESMRKLLSLVDAIPD